MMITRHMTETADIMAVRVTHIQTHKSHTIVGWAEQELSEAEERRAYRGVRASSGGDLGGESLLPPNLRNLVNGGEWICLLLFRSR